jgi:hypothetical protein
MSRFSGFVFIALMIIFVLVEKSGPGQITASNDSTKQTPTKDKSTDTIVRKHNPTKATIYSMIVPGLGQAYNKKYWKIPVVYAGFGVLYYFIRSNDKEYKLWRAAYNHALTNSDSLELPVNDYERLYGYNTDILKSQKNYYRRNRDLSYILASVWYLLNIVDATVDAQMFTWDIDDNLSMKIEPTLTEPLFGNKTGTGLKLTLRF